MSILEQSITDLLHTDDVRGNKLLDLNAPSGGPTYFLSRPEEEDFTAYILRLVSERAGKTGTTLLRGSSSVPGRAVGRNVNSLDWEDADGNRNIAALTAFIDSLYRDIMLKGGNPLFLGLGALAWRVPVGKDGYRDVLTPLIIVPVLPTRGGKGSPVALEFIDDDVTVNPCLMAKLRETGLKEVADGFPLPTADENGEMDISDVTPQYFEEVRAYAESCRGSDDAVFEFRPSVAALARYDHGDVCMYRDIRSSRGDLDSDEKVRRIFFGASDLPAARAPMPDLQFPLPIDSIQENIAGRIAAGESLIIKGPPGSGKTQTIANIVCALMGKGKSVIFASKKTSALSEVYAKMPDKLRPFAMLLESETEAQAAALRPEAVTSDLKALVRSRETYKMPGESVYGRRRRAVIALSEAEKFLYDYRKEMFSEGAIAGMSYFRALDILSGSRVTPVNFISAEDAAELSAADYGEARARAEEIYSLMTELTGGGKHAAALCPYYGVTAENDAEEVRSALILTGDAAEELLTILRGEEGAEKFSPRALADICGSGISADEVEGAAEFVREHGEEPDKALRACPETVTVRFEPYDGMRVTYEKLVAAEAHSMGLTVKQLRTLLPVMRRIGEDSDKNYAALTALSATASVFAERAAHGFSKAAEVLKARADLTGEDIAALTDAAKPLSGYAGTQARKIGFFDFAAKKALKKLAPLIVRGDASVAEVADAVVSICDALESEGKAESAKAKVRSMAGDDVSDEGIRLALHVAQIPDTDIAAFAAKLPDTVAAAEAALVAGTEDSTLRELKNAFYEGMLYGELTVLVRAFSSGENVRELARAATALKGASYDMVDAAKSLVAGEKRDRVGAAAKKAADALSDFGRKYYRNALTEGAATEKFALVSGEWSDARLYDAAVRMNALICGGKTDMLRFFSPIAYGNVRVGDIGKLFELSFLRAATEGYARKHGITGNGFGRAAERAINKREAARAEIAETDTEAIAARCMAAIDPSDKSLAFLCAERGAARNLRRLFKDHAAAIMRLKKCLILSPSTVSLLLGSNEFFDFDVGIVDEASQLEPAGILPVLMRCRTIVIVGDEWQMPPMRDFRASAGDDPYGEYEALPSALSVALNSAAFRVCELVCHYRSRTESLIAFSRHRYYPYMRTFPAALPRVDGELGFNDIFTDGYCVKGVNVEEAMEVMRVIRAHFDKYYDDKSGRLSRSFGVVSFGEPQNDYIKMLVAADSALSEKMRRALAASGDVPEKLMFFKTIRTVQGQETDDLILSLTYGRRADGALWQSYGTLNRGALGECVFNVAVTRARCSVTVVHSVRGADIAGSSVGYIGEYLDMAERFSRGGRVVFGGSDHADGFTGSVGDYIKSLGVSEERIVYDCGVTDGSVRVPIAVLSEDLSRAVLGVWCERGPECGYDYNDLNSGYYDSLKERGWQLHRVFVHDWMFNAEAEKKSLAEAVKSAIGASATQIRKEGE